MSPERWKQIEDLFDRASDLPDTERVVFLDQVADPELRDEVRKLLEGDRGAITALDSMIQREAALVSVQRIGPYRVTGTIGHGGMGAVYRAERDDYRKQVAIKIVRRGLEGPYAVTRFRQERQILASLDHPNIARLLDGGSMEDGLPYIVMEYIEGVPVTQFSGSTTDKLRLFSAVCGAVQYAHRKLIIHRDIKPGNILVTPEGVPKLLDFGIAKLLDPELSADGEMPETSTGLRMMTPDYASPEQLRGETVSTATDVYSLGLVLRELLASGASGGELETVIGKATHPEPERRYASADQLAEDIARYLEGRPILARPDTFGYTAGKFLKRNKAAVAGVCVVSLSIAGGAVATIWQARQTQERFDQVRNLANRFLFDFHDKIQYLPGSTQAREMVVSTAQEYLDKLAGPSGGDPLLQFELGVAYRKVGDAQGLPKEPNLGRPKDALTSYHKAVAILERLGSAPKVLRELGYCHLHIVAVDHFSGDKKGEKQAIESARAIGEQDSLIGGLAYLARGDQEMAANDVQGSLTDYRKSLELNRSVLSTEATDEARRRVTVSLNSLGIAQGRAGDLEGALVSLREAEKLRRPDMNDVRDLRWMGILYQNLGNALGDPNGPSLERNKEALEAYRKQYAIAEQLFKADPADSTARADMLRANLKLAQFLLADDPKSGVEFARQGMGLLSGLPEGLEKTFNLAALEDAQASLLLKLGRLDESYAASQRAIAAARKMLANTANNASPEEAEQVAANDLGDIQVALGRNEEALRSYRLAIRVAEKDLEEFPSGIDARYALGYSYHRMAQYWLKQHAHQQAVEWMRKEERLWRDWNARFIPNPYARRHEQLARQAAEKKF